MRNLSNFDLPFVVTISVSIIAVVLTYVDMRRRLARAGILSVNGKSGSYSEGRIGIIQKTV